MQPELQPDSTLFAGRYTVVRTAASNHYGFTYVASDRSTDTRVFIHEFFPHAGCQRNAQTFDMAIRRDNAAQVSALYKEFTRYVSNLKDGLIPGGQKLIHAFKDHGTAYYVTAADDSAALSPKPAAPRQQPAGTTVSTPKKANPAPAVMKPMAEPARKQPTDIERPEKKSSPDRARAANYRNAIMWYRIVIFLLLCIVLLLVYLTFLSPSPKVKSAHPVTPATTEASAPQTSATEAL